MNRCVFCGAVESFAKLVLVTNAQAGDVSVSDKDVACEDIVACEQRMSNEHRSYWDVTVMD